MNHRRALILAVILTATAATAQTTFYGSAGAAGGGSGSVTSVAATVPGELAVSGSPITTSGTFAFSWNTQLTNRIFAGPCGSTGTPTFRVLCSADIPNNAANTTGNAATATALAANPSDCSANNFATAIAASGNLTCAQPAVANLSDAATLVLTDDSRLTDSRTPIAHASTHASAGADPVTLAQSQVTNLTTDLAGKQATGNYITALTGDVAATGPGSVASTLATVNSNVGTFTNATVTVNAKGLVTAASTGSGGSAPFSDATAIVKDDGDATKLFAIQASGITTGNTVTASPPIPTGSFTFARQDAAQTFTGAQTFAGSTTINATGNVGIKTAATSDALTVSGSTFVDGALFVRAGSITGTAINVGATRRQGVNSAGNTAGTETPLNSASADNIGKSGGNDYLVDTASVSYDFAGTIAGTASVDKRIRIRLGSTATSADTALFDSGDLAITSAATWTLRGRVWRTGVSGQKSSWTLHTSDAAVPVKVFYSATSVSLAGNAFVTITVAGTNANDVTLEAYTAIWTP